MAFKELKVQEWFEEISKALEYRRLYGLETQWAALEAMFYGVHSSQYSVGPNLIYETGDALLSVLTVPNPFVLVKARRPEFVETAPIVESVDNKLIKDLKMRLVFEQSALHAFLWGRAIVKIGFDSEFGWDPLGDFGFGMSISQFDKKGRSIEFGRTKPGMPWISTVKPHDFLVPWGTRSIDQAPWVAHRIVRHVDDVKADSKYKTKGLQPVMSMEDFTKSYETTAKPYRSGIEQPLMGQAGSSGTDSSFSELWEIHDRRTGKLFVIATGHYKSFLRNEENYLFLDGRLPFVSYSLIPDTRNFWVTPDAYYLKAAQAELIDISIQNTKQRRIAVAKVIAAAGAFDRSEMNRLKSADVGAIIEAAAGHDINKVIKIFSPQGVNTLNYQEAEAIRRDARTLTGFSRNELGEYETRGRRTATEVRSVRQGSDRRMGRRQLKIRDAYIEVMQRVNSIIARFWTSPHVAMVAGEDGSTQWKSFVGAQLRGAYDYDIQFSQEMEETPETEAQRGLMLYSALMQDPAVDQIELRKFLLYSMRHNISLQRIFRPEVMKDANIRLQVSGLQGLPGGSEGNQGPQQGQTALPQV